MHLWFANAGDIRMNPRASKNIFSLRGAGKTNERGYALLLMMFFVALLTLTAAMASPDILTRGRREKEEEMVWRGRQYIRGIKLFYTKNHRIPASIDELLKAQPGVRYMRKAYKDPLNDTDGTWRLIQLGPAGQLIGSTQPNNVFTMAVPGGIAGSNQAGSGLRGNSFGTTSFSSSQNLAVPGAQSNSSSFGMNITSTPSAPSAGPDAPGSPVYGAGVIGVGSKINKNSIRQLHGAKNYLQFEFIWDPSKEGMGVAPAKLLNAPPTTTLDPGQLSPTIPPASTSTGQTGGLRDPQTSGTPE